MIDNITFLNNDWTWDIVFGAVVLWLIFVWKEWSQSGRRRFVLKSFLAFLAVTSLALIALKPAVPGANGVAKGVLLTEGYNSSQLDSLRKAHKNLTILNYQTNEPLQPELNSMSQVFVLGRGLKPFDLWQLDEVPAIYLGGNFPKGVIQINYEQENSVGDSLVLKGQYEKPKNGNRLVLQGPGGMGLDSISLNIGERQQFQLAADLKVQGKYLFSLVEKDSLGETLSLDPMPVIVNEKDLLKVLVLNAFPTFETKYLKSFLAEAGHQVLVRSQVTTNRYKFEYFNMERVPLSSLSESTLEAFDLLIIDANSLGALSGGERNALEESVREEGLGVFIQADADFFTSPGNFSPFGFLRGNSTEAALDQYPKIEMFTQPFRFRDGFGLQNIHTSNATILTAYQRMGEGRIGTTVFENTWQLLLEGHTTAYQQFWSPIVENVSKKATSAVEWKPNSLMAFQDEPFNFQLRTSVADLAIRNSEGNNVPLRRDIDISSLWNGTNYPRKTGWNKLQQDTTEGFEYYVAHSTHWRSLTAHKTVVENRSYFDRYVRAGQEYRPLEPVNLLWLFLVFLLCVGYLWLEPKLFK